MFNPLFINSDRQTLEQSLSKPDFKPEETSPLIKDLQNKATEFSGLLNYFSSDSAKDKVATFVQASGKFSGWLSTMDKLPAAEREAQYKMQNNAFSIPFDNLMNDNSTLDALGLAMSRKYAESNIAVDSVKSQGDWNKFVSLLADR